MALAQALQRLQAGQFSESEALYRQILAAEPDNIEALNNLGNVLTRCDRFDEAEPLYRRALEVNPAYPEFWGNLANVLNGLNRPAEAEACARRALALNQDYVAGRHHLGNALQAMGRLEVAETCFREALARKPESAKLHLSLGTVLYELGRFDEAIDSFLLAQAIEPANADAHGYEGMLRLLKGEYPRGWRAYEWRWHAKSSGLAPRRFAQPQWCGGEIRPGSVVLLHAEQGLGDTLQFVRYAPLVAAAGAEVVLEVPKVLVPLMRGLEGVNRVVAAGQPLPPFDLHAPLLGLPLAFGTTVQNIPRRIPYLGAGSAAASTVRGAQETQVGLCWKGDARYKNDKYRSVAFESLAPLFEVPEVRFVSLQKDLDPRERELCATWGNFSHPGADFATTAEIVASLDLVITVDTAWAHWAGAVGRPVWVLLAKVPHWCWMLDRGDSPWYPTATLYRQQARGDWPPVVRTVADELVRWLRRQEGAPVS